MNTIWEGCFCMKSKIAIARPFDGVPKIMLPSIIGASAKKPILYRIPVIGQRPMKYSVKGLPNGLELNDNILSGKIEYDGSYEIIVSAKNALGESVKRITLEIANQNVLVTPLMGYTTWNAFASDVTQKDVEGITKRLVELGITEFGYSYINTDSGWQKEYGGKFDAVMPNSKFPDMKAMTEYIHSFGLKCGIYSTPMLTAWGCPKEFESIPGCTQGEPDIRFSSTNGGIGVIRKERNNALQFEDWGFDYLKYDWTPTDPVNAEYMRSELVKLSRDFGFCVTVTAIKGYPYWSHYCHSYRSNRDSYCYWDNLVENYTTYFNFMDEICKGHYFDLDMLDIGTCRAHHIANLLTDDEKVVAFTMRAFFNSPIQISSTLENISDLELSIYCNEEILAINQDCAFNTSLPIVRVNEGTHKYDIFEKRLEDGSYAYAIFNLGEVEECIELTTDASIIRDVWAKEDVSSNGNFSFSVFPHTVKVLRIDSKAIF